MRARMERMNVAGHGHLHGDINSFSLRYCPHVQYQGLGAIDTGIVKPDTIDLTVMLEFWDVFSSTVIVALAWIVLQ